jgi:hypothetical protein
VGDGSEDKIMHFLFDARDFVSFESLRSLLRVGQLNYQCIRDYVKMSTYVYDQSFLNKEENLGFTLSAFHSCRSNI